MGTAAQCGGTTDTSGNPPPPPGGVTTPAAKCTVPKLAGKSLPKARRLLSKAGCKLGKVKRPAKPRNRRLRPLIVASQSPRAGRKVAKGTKVALRLKEAPARRGV